jgi:predicted enzyme related to lactoylglutathione lyase
MSSPPAVRALNVTVADVDAGLSFYAALFPGCAVSEGTFAGIRYGALTGADGEVAVCIFERGDNVPLAASFPTVMVDSVASSLKTIQRLDGRVLVEVNPCPCTGAPFAICEDATGNQLMIKQPRQQKDSNVS